MTGDVFHVLDLWDSPDAMSEWISTLGPILDEFGMKLDGQPEVGEFPAPCQPYSVVSRTQSWKTSMWAPISTRRS
ncbi:MAG: hypothetical protein JWQ37_3708 [Blastococcus sp.]|nr:hypothetical protein [Blastococcus sp.]